MEQRNKAPTGESWTPPRRDYLKLNVHAYFVESTGKNGGNGLFTTSSSCK